MTSKTKRRVQKRARATGIRTRPQAARPRPVVAPAPQRSKPGPWKLVASQPRRLYSYAVVTALALGALLIGLSQMSVHRGASTAAPSTTGVTGAAETAALFRGIPQRGTVLGSSTAPVQLVEYADPQCPYCALYANEILPTVVRNYVRTGRVQLVFRGLGFIGPDSETALRTATAAASQNRFWNVLDLLYRNQGPENAWVNDEVLRAIVAAAGADATQVFNDRNSASVTNTINGWKTLALSDGINGVPSFYIGRRGASLERLQTPALTVSEFRTALDAALRQ